MRTAVDYAREAASLEAECERLEREKSKLVIAARDCIASNRRLQAELRAARERIQELEGGPYDYAA